MYSAFCLKFKLSNDQRGILLERTNKMVFIGLQLTIQAFCFHLEKKGKQRYFAIRTSGFKAN